MSSPFSSWRRRRATSITSQDFTEDDSSFVTAQSPPGPSHGNAGDKKDLSSSVTREPIRSFIHGSVRDHLSKLSYSACGLTLPVPTLTVASSPRQRPVCPLCPARHSRAGDVSPFRPLLRAKSRLPQPNPGILLVSRFRGRGGGRRSPDAHTVIRDYTGGIRALLARDCGGLQHTR